MPSLTQVRLPYSSSLHGGCSCGATVVKREQVSYHQRPWGGCRSHWTDFGGKLIEFGGGASDGIDSATWSAGDQTEVNTTTAGGKRRYPTGQSSP